MRPKYGMAGPMLALGLTLLLPGIAAVARAQALGREPTHAKPGDAIRGAARGTNLDAPLGQAEPRCQAGALWRRVLPRLDLDQAARDRRAMPRFEPARRSWGARRHQERTARIYGGSQ
jgi:hypothetical protein